MENILSRSQMLIGEDNIKKLSGANVCVIGCGGVGGFVVEALARSGVNNLTIVDKDKVDITNINRQVMAFNSTIGVSKVEALKKILCDINGSINIMAYEVFVTRDNLQDIIPGDCDFVVDAIDTISSKLDIIEYCKKENIKIISSMGMGNRLLPEGIKIEDINKTKNCPLSKVIRKELKNRNIKKLDVIYCDSLPISKKRPPASMVFAPGICGLMIGGYIVSKIIEDK